MSDYIAREDAKTALGVEAEISTAAETALEDAIGCLQARGQIRVNVRRATR